MEWSWFCSYHFTNRRHCKTLSAQKAAYFCHSGLVVESAWSEKKEVLLILATELRTQWSVGSNRLKDSPTTYLVRASSQPLLKVLPR